jgi:RNA polymerase sigma-70 factor, ECF subfamily
MKTLALVAPVGMDGAEEFPDSLAAAKAGDRAAFEHLMRLHGRLVLATALRLLGNMSDAQDASQEVFLKLYRSLGQVTSTNLPGWLYRVTVNVCHDMHRGAAKAAANEIEAAAAGDPQRLLLESERRELVRRSLRRLSEKERQALVLRDIEGLSTAEVARAMGTAEATVRSHIWKARLKMREFVEGSFRRRV